MPPGLLVGLHLQQEAAGIGVAILACLGIFMLIVNPFLMKDQLQVRGGSLPKGWVERFKCLLSSRLDALSSPLLHVDRPLY